MQFVVYVDWYAPEGLTAAATKALAEFRPHDESLCVWTDTPMSRMVRLSLEVDAEEFEAAGRLGRSTAAEMARVGGLGGRLLKLTAMTEEESQEWRGDEES